MVSLNDYYVNECATEMVAKLVDTLFEAKVGDGVEPIDHDGDGFPEDFLIDIDKLIDDELDIEYDDDYEFQDDQDGVDESMKARAPKLRGKAEKARKNKAKIMKALMANPDVQSAIARLKSILLRTARSESSKLGVNNRAVMKALKGKVKI